MNRPSSTSQLNPFPGLRPFREGEEYVFFGRESQVDTMVDKLAETRFLAVVGTSGSGKSSLINCGLGPALYRGLMAKAGTAWRMIKFRPGSNPLRALAHVLAQEGTLFSGFASKSLTLEQIVEATLGMSKRGLLDIYQQAQLDRNLNLLIVVDQFEELFRYHMLGASRGEDGYGASEEAIAFINVLLEVPAQTTRPIYVVITMRSDFLGDCAQFPGLPEAINKGQYLVPRMTREERREAISGPTTVGRAELSPVLLTRLVNDVGDNPDQLSILQHAMNRTWACWEKRGGKGPIGLEHYDAIGTMAHALNDHAEEAYSELISERKKICEKLFKALTDKGTDPRGIRRPTKLSTLCALADASVEEVTSVIEVFRDPSRSFLMPPVPESLHPETVIDISHESLMRVWGRLNKWAREEALSAQLYHRLAETAALHADGKAGLWRDPDLQVALDWCDKEKPSAAWARQHNVDFDRAMGFLEESERARDRELAEREEVRKKELKRVRTLAAILGSAFIIALVLGGYAVQQRQKAERQQEAADQQRDIAFEQRLEADRQRQNADRERGEAERQQKLAIQQEKEALRQKEIANRQRDIALEQQRIANEQRLEADRQRQNADREREEAERQQKLAQDNETKANEAGEEAARALNQLADVLKEQLASSDSGRVVDALTLINEINKNRPDSVRLFLEIPEPWSERAFLGKLAFDLEHVPARDDQRREQALKVRKMPRAAFIKEIGLAPPTAREDNEYNKRIRLDGGHLNMGNPEGEVDAGSDERPQRRVKVSPFYLQEQEVSNAEYWRFDPEHSQDSRADHPVVNVNWYQAMGYAAWLDGSLPSEAQWEFAARGVEGWKYPWGDEEPTPQHANYSSVERRPVNSFVKGKSPQGISNLAGNVWEWCLDWYAPYPNSEQKDPIGPENGSYRVLRGGSFLYFPRYLRGAARHNRNPYDGDDLTGFRVAWPEDKRP